MLTVQSSDQKKLYQPLQDVVYGKFKYNEEADNVNQLLQALCGNHIRNISIEKSPGKANVLINLEKHQYKHLGSTDLYIPEKLAFNIFPGRIRFISYLGKDAPYEESTSYCSFLKNRVFWWDIRAQRDKLDLWITRRDWWCPSICEGIPDFNRVDAKEFIKTIHSN